MLMQAYLASSTSKTPKQRKFSFENLLKKLEVLFLDFWNKNFCLTKIFHILIFCSYPVLKRFVTEMPNRCFLSLNLSYFNTESYVAGALKNVQKLKSLLTIKLIISKHLLI